MIDLREIDDFDKPTISQPPNPGPSTRPGSGEDAYTLIRTQEQRTLKMTVWIMTSVCIYSKSTETIILSVSDAEQGSGLFTFVMNNGNFLCRTLVMAETLS